MKVEAGTSVASLSLRPQTRMNYLERTWEWITLSDGCLCKTSQGLPFTCHSSYQEAAMRDVLIHTRNVFISTFHPKSLILYVQERLIFRNEIESAPLCLSLEPRLSLCNMFVQYTLFRPKVFKNRHYQADEKGEKDNKESKVPIKKPYFYFPF